MKEDSSQVGSSASMIAADDDLKKILQGIHAWHSEYDKEDKKNKEIPQNQSNPTPDTETDKKKERIDFLASLDAYYDKAESKSNGVGSSFIKPEEKKGLDEELKKHSYYHNDDQNPKLINSTDNHTALSYKITKDQESISIVHHDNSKDKKDEIFISEETIARLKAQTSTKDSDPVVIAVDRVDDNGNRMKGDKDYLIFQFNEKTGKSELIVEASVDADGNPKGQTRIQGLEHIVEAHAMNKEHYKEHVLGKNIGVEFGNLGLLPKKIESETLQSLNNLPDSSIANSQEESIAFVPSNNQQQPTTLNHNADVSQQKNPSVNIAYNNQENKLGIGSNSSSGTNPGITALNVPGEKDNTYSVTLSNDDGKTLNVSFQQDEKQRLFSVDKEKLKSFLKEQSELPHNLPLKKEKFQPNLDAIIQDQNHDLTAKDFNEMTQAMNGLVLQGIAKKAEQNPSVNIINANQPKERVFLRLLDESMKEANKYSEAIKIGEEIDKFYTSKSLDSKTRVQLLKLVTRYDDKNQKQKEREALIRTPNIGPILKKFIDFRKSENVAQNSGPSTANNVITNEKQSSIDIPLSSATQKKEVANPNTPPPPPPINQRPTSSNPHPLTSSVKSGVAVSLPGETEEQTYGRELINAVIIKDAKVETVENIMQKIVENGGDLENIINNPLGEKGTGLSPFHMAIYTQQTPDIVVAMSTFADFDKKNYNDKSAVDLINESPKKDAAIETGNKASIDTKLPNTPPPPPQSNAKSGIAVPSTHITPTDDVKKSTSSLPKNLLGAITGQSHTLQDAKQRVLKPKEVQISAFEQNIIIASNIGNSEVTNENDREFKFEIRNNELSFVKETTNGNKPYKLTKDSITNYQDIFNKVEDDFESSNISKEDQLNTKLNKVIQTQDDKDKAAANQPEVEKTSITPQPISQTSDQTTIINDSKSSSLGLEDKTTKKLSSIHSVLSESVTKRRAGINDDEESIDFKLVENKLYFVKDQKDYELDNNSIKNYGTILKNVNEEITEKKDYKEGDKISIDLSKNQIEELNNLVKEPTKTNKISDKIKKALSSKLFPSKINKENLPKINSLSDERKKDLEAILKLKPSAEKNRSISSESISSEASTDKESTLSSPPNSPKSKNSKSYLTVGGTVQPTKEIAGDIAGDIELTQLTTNHKIKRQTTHNKSGYGELSPPPSPNGGKPQGGKGMV
ncbi:hypothetical protein SZ25_00757 [Candidatus Arcanobacter lacustris]|uniref:Uncharacterized protein n=1 Tax=Candidatus Arcanibacter lacustris TaxID=1607817 RepID=A0A0F5MPY7_9RICK|nr:hypothetical protein SZ25_00757 [Candidatus Arcanobacter lacustris]